MIKQTRFFFHRKLLFLPLVLSLLAGGCGSGSTEDPGSTVQTTQTTINGQVTPTEVNNSSNSSTTNTSTTNENIFVNTNAQQYVDSFVQLSYPEGWILDTSNTDVTALFLEPELNDSGGRKNCLLISDSLTGLNLIENVDALLELYNDNPAPQTSFVNVNGAEMARITGKLTSFGVAVDATHQVAVDRESTHYIQCVGVEPDDVELIFNSMVIK